MQGVIFHELRGYAESRLGAQGWESLQLAAGLPRRIYLAFKDYPDAEVAALVDAASKLTGQPRLQVLEELGERLGPSLLRTYGVLVEPGWTVLDMVEHMERLHAQVRRDGQTRPPSLVCRRMRRDVVQVSYSSPRKLCRLGIGTIRGLARHLGQTVEVRERRCMHAGALTCELEVSLLG
ncbi:heme NO-binding domain-containing protein [Pyxidicoccus xibeiensis]|uniref:heme NO-binding domain-containing protein n=1 Tax=Pyxidicoccus xibeiensis TaxID=2906759 RepID=UPI0020A7B93F|nr:heme NO-binding domain-containing protein [Pyxidicoccus xibeiensis]MCP3136486.1 heme NO-binding domain-containing protein [Pyxidicoccus xibeiensis]